MALMYSSALALSEISGLSYDSVKIYLAGRIRNYLIDYPNSVAWAGQNEVPLSIMFDFIERYGYIKISNSTTYNLVASRLDEDRALEPASVSEWIDERKRNLSSKTTIICVLSIDRQDHAWITIRGFDFSNDFAIKTGYLQHPDFMDWLVSSAFEREM